MAKHVNKVFTMQVAEVELAEWRRRAEALSISVAELIRLKMRAPDAPASVEPSPKPIDLNALEKEWRRKWEAEHRPSFSHGRGKATTVGDAIRSGLRAVSAAVDPKTHHVSGPVLASPVPTKLVGDVEPFFKAGQKAAQERLKP